MAGARLNFCRVRCVEIIRLNGCKPQVLSDILHFQTAMKSTLALLTFAVMTAASAAESSPSSLSYNRDIRPILTDSCFACHGPDSAARKASLRLDSFAMATAERKDSKPAIVPGKPEESSLIARIFTTDEDDVMPPVKTKKFLKPEHKELLKRWVAEGAKYEAHWSFIPPVKAEPPAVQKQDWVRNPIDQFILAGLEQAGLTPAEEADRKTLARRLSLDLTGLPPAPEVVRNFEEDKSPDAYEKLVDQFLSSERYGEHRGRYWLDAARYADTHGIHIDNYREIWAYRDWVINAFNQNIPFDQFTTEQLAGDLLPSPTMEQKIATGFNRCNITTSEGGAIDEEYYVLYTRDRTETTSAVWMGLTAGCATCHDHKYDPLTQKEFYQMSAFFNNTTQPAMDGNKRDTPPIIVVPTKGDRSRWEELPTVKGAAKERIDKRREGAGEDFKKWMANTKPDSILDGLPNDGLQFAAPLIEPLHQDVNVFVKGSVRNVALGSQQEGITGPHAFSTSKEIVPTFEDVGNFDRGDSFSIGLWVKLHESDKNGAIISRMDEDDKFRGWDFWFQDGRPGIHFVSAWPEDALKVVSRRAVDNNKWAHVYITYNGSGKADGVKVFINGQQQDVERPTDKLKGSTLSKAPFKIGQRKNGDHIEKAAVQDIRIYSKMLSREEIALLHTKPRLAWLAKKPEGQRNDEEKKSLYEGYLASYDSEFMAATTAMAALDQEERDIKTRGTIAHIMQEKQDPPAAFVLFRGEYDKRRDKVGAATPEFLPAFSEEAPKNRLGLAKWLLRPDHPLTTRVTVNRMWLEIFGNGIVRTAADFGVTGELPSNQQLLDWLAVHFRESGWDMKAFYKMLVMSSAYRQAQTVTPEKLAKDPENRLLSRGARFRLDAEVIRDYALASSGLLSSAIGGPSVRPYQPEGVWEMVAMPESDTRNYKRDDGEKLYRRSMYTFWKRTAPPASMDIFNAPNRETCTIRRERTNTPLQALATLNDTQLIEAARKLAERALSEGGDSDQARLDYIAWRVLARPLRDNERVVVESVLKDLREHYEAAPKAAEELLKVGEAPIQAKIEPALLAAFTMTANQLMNLDEALNK